MDHINWQYVFAEAVVTIIPLALLGWVGYRKLWWILQEFRPHGHDEKEGTLHVSGIRYPRTLNGRH